MKESWKRVIVLTSIVAISVVVLSSIYNITEPEIAKQKEIKFEEMLQSIFPLATGYSEKKGIYEVYSDNKRVGYAFMADGTGYGGDIEILVGVNEDKTIKGIKILKHTETPGLGAKITERGFTDQFGGKSIGDIRLKKDGGKIDAITGATISSSAVVDTVYEKYMEKIKMMEEK